MEHNNFQRVGASSNTAVGRDFEDAAHDFLARSGLNLRRDFALPIGYKVKKVHRFDFGAEAPPVLVECKSYTWTAGGNSPSAKIRGMNEVLLHFSVAPARFRKIMLLLKHLHQRTNQSLAAHYLRTQAHLIGPDVEVWELDVDTGEGGRLL